MYSHIFHLQTFMMTENGSLDSTDTTRTENGTQNLGIMCLRAKPLRHLMRLLKYKENTKKKIKSMQHSPVTFSRWIAILMR